MTDGPSGVQPGDVENFLSAKVGFAVSDLLEAFNTYQEIKLGFPARKIRFSNESVRVLTIPPASQRPDDDEDDEEDIEIEEFVLIEEELPPEILNAVNDDVIYEEDISLSINYNSFTGEWNIAFAPVSDIGFLVTGSNLMEVMRVATDNLVNRIRFETGDVDGCADSADEEIELYCKGVLNGSSEED